MAKDREHGGPAEERADVPLWKKLLLVLAGVFVVAGIALRFAPAPEAQSAGGSEVGAAFVAGEEGGEVDQPRGAADWSPFFLQGGFGFFLGFCLGTVLRTFFKLFAFGVGLLLLLLLGLQYAGIDIPWDSLRSAYDAVAGRVSEHAAGFLAFLQGAIPAAAFSGAGLVAGLKKN